MARHNELGKLGEELARNYLVAQGYAIVKQDEKVGYTDIDLVAMKGNVIAFVEVKTRTGYMPPLEEMINSRKRLRMAQAANRYLRHYNVVHEPTFDIVTVCIQADGTHRIEHYPNAFLSPSTQR